MTTRTLAPCGTRAAYERHKYHGEDTDDACRIAYNRRVGAWRRASIALACLPEMGAEYESLIDQQAKGPRRYAHAQAELARRHPAKFRQLLDEELTAAGVRFCQCGAEVVDSAFGPVGHLLNR